MAANHDELERLLRIAETDPSSLSNADLARLDTLLSADDATLAQHASRPAKPDIALASRLDLAEQATLPTAAQWNRVWHAVESAASHGRAATRAPVILRLRRATYIAVAAAILLAVAVWIPRPTAESSSDEPIRLASSVEIHSLEVSDGTPFVVSVGNGGAEVIWVLNSGG